LIHAIEQGIDARAETDKPDPDYDAENAADKEKPEYRRENQLFNSLRHGKCHILVPSAIGLEANPDIIAIPIFIEFAHPEGRKSRASGG
jgi:hypothetical protein